MVQGDFIEDTDVFMMQAHEPLKQPDTLNAQQRLAISERRHRLLAENARDVVWSMSPTGQITYISQAVEKLRGLTPQEAMAQSIDEILTPASQTQVIDYFAKVHQASAQGEELPSFRGDLAYYRKDGSTFWTEVFAFPIADDQGQLIEILGVTRDIQERKQYEDGLQEARLAAEQANHAKTRFLAHISHEMRTPLTTLLTWLELARAQPDSVEQKDLLQKSKDAGQLLLGIINDLLDLSRLEQGSLKLRHQPFNIHQVLAQVRELTLPLLDTTRVEFCSSIDALVPDRLVGDATRLTQAILNLTGNAAKFTQSGRITVNVDLAIPITDKQAHLRFSVADTGPGIDAQWHAQLFDDLFQVPDTQSSRATGTGLGLPITKRLSHMMGGTAGVESTPGQGSTFWFTAVVEIDLTHRPRTVATDHVPDLAQANFLVGKRVLMVEDYQPLRQAMAKTLSRLGVLVDEADNGASALAQAQRQPYDLILMDLSMPVMDGKTCTMRLREIPELKNLPIIGLTAAGFEEDRQALLAIGMSDYLLKPFQLEELISAMSDCLGVCATNPAN